MSAQAAGDLRTEPIWIDNNGLVVWKGTWVEPDNSSRGVGIRTGFFRDQELLLRDADTFGNPEDPAPAGLPGNISFWPGQEQFALSDNGQWLMTRLQTFNSNPLTPFAFRDRAVLIELPAPTCPCERTGDPQTVDVLDLLAFLGDWFENDPGADINGSGTVTVLDLLDFLSCWFPASTGACP